MTVMTADYAYVTSEKVVREVAKLLDVGSEMRGSTAVTTAASMVRCRRSLLELDGLGKEIWEGIDPEQYIDGLRNEWNDR